MSYSCSIAANYTLDAIQALIGDPTSSNKLSNDGFWQRGRENSDGAITGVVYKPHPTQLGYVITHGSFRIEPTGTITRWPGMKQDMKDKALKLAYKLCEKDRNGYAADFIFRHVIKDAKMVPTDYSLSVF